MHKYADIKIPQLRTKYAKGPAVMRFQQYANGRTAITVWDSNTGQPWLTATVNLPDVPLPDNCVFIKDYSENEGVLDELVRLGIVDADVVKPVNTQFVTITAHRLLVTPVKE